MASITQQNTTDYFSPIRITPKFTKTQKRTKFACVTWWIFIATRRFVPESRKLSYSCCVAWQTFNAAKWFLGKNLETSITSSNCSHSHFLIPNVIQFLWLLPLNTLVGLLTNTYPKQLN